MTFTRKTLQIQFQKGLKVSLIGMFMIYGA